MDDFDHLKAGTFFWQAQTAPKVVAGCAITGGGIGGQNLPFDHHMETAVYQSHGR